MVGAAVTVKETGRSREVTAVAPAAQIVTTPLWVPAVREPVVTLYGHGAISSARARGVRQPGGVMTDAPV